MAYDFVAASSQSVTGTLTFSSVNVLSMAFWMNLDSLATWLGLFTSRSSGFQGLILSSATGNPLAFSWDGAASEYNAASGLSITTGTWYLAGMAVSSTAVKLYLGTPSSISSYTHSASMGTNSPSVWNIANDPGGPARYADGRFAEVAIWAATLADADFTMMSKGYSPRLVRPDALRWYSPLVRDLREYRSGVSLTNNNTATVATHPPVLWQRSKKQIRERASALAAGQPTMRRLGLSGYCRPAEVGREGVRVF